MDRRMGLQPVHPKSDCLLSAQRLNGKFTEMWDSRTQCFLCALARVRFCRFLIIALCCQQAAGFPPHQVPPNPKPVASTS